MRVEIDGEKVTDFYLTADLTKKEISILDKVLKVSDEGLRKFNKRIQETAKVRGKKCKNIVLRDAQIRPMLMSLVTKRFFIGDKPGLGKTVMSGASYANYIYHMKRKNRDISKILVVTTGSHVIGFSKEWESFGINILPLYGGSAKIEKTLENNDLTKYDGIIINWDGLKTNGFLNYYLRNSDEYGYAIFDETGTLTNNKSMTYKTVNNIVNKYRGGIERVIFLNGSSFEKNIFDFYYQFKILKPKLIPNKQFLEENYVIRGGKPANFLRIGGMSTAQSRVVSRHVGEIIDYKNQSELKERIKYFYIARSKEDYSKDIPKHNHVLHLVEMTNKQRKELEKDNNNTILNSPRTRDKNKTLTVKNSPKLTSILDFAESTEEDRPLLYVYNKESQRTIKEELTKRGYKVSILNGDTKQEDKDKIIAKFNNYKLDMLILNVERALNIPTSDRILFYDIPTMPQRTNQIKGRIDRDNYETIKFYNFFCYLNSPEMMNIIRLAYFREHHGNEFTGQKDYTYKELIDQLSVYFGENVMGELSTTIEEDDDFFDSDGWEEEIEEIIYE